MSVVKQVAARLVALLRRDALDREFTKRRNRTSTSRLTTTCGAG